jgi:cbb3-type cytochrome oxidase subunit 3
MAGFLAVVFWAYSSKRSKDFEEASMLPFTEADPDQKDEEKAA